MAALTLLQAYDLAIQLQREGRLEESELLCRQILQRSPNHPEVVNTLAILVQQNGRPGEAVDLYASAIATNPTLPELHYNLANVHKDLGDFQLAIDGYRQALALRPDFRPALNNLANALKETGAISEAKEIYRRTLSIHPDPRIASSLAYLMYFDPEASPADIAAEHARWNETYAKPLFPDRLAHSNNRDAIRRLRIGYVSPDFRNHPVARFLEPILAHVDREKFENICYSDVRRPDSMTARLQSLAHHWRDITRLSDAMLADLVRQDQIDILVDLTMHMEGNRLLTFARKPAPIQVTYLAYAGTTGLRAIDYRISDPHLDPPGADESVYSERTVRLACYWCYCPPAEASEVAPLPALSKGYVTFGCLNNFSKVNQRVLESWRQILGAVPESRLILTAHKGSHRDRVLNFFSESHIAPDRIEFKSVMPFGEYLSQYNEIDIALDPFPYPGGTTSLDAIYMGVPLVTFAAQTALSRAGVTILKNLDLPEFIADTASKYQHIAIGLAQDAARLSALRDKLRLRLLRSPLIDPEQISQGVESIFRQIWSRWCQSSDQHSPEHSP